MGSLEDGVLLVDDGALVLTRCAVAGSWRARAWGLLGRSGLDPGEGLLLPGCRSVHTFGMRMTIGVVFLARGGRVARVVPSLRPCRVTGHRHAVATLETSPAAAAAVAPGAWVRSDHAIIRSVLGVDASISSL